MAEINEAKNETPANPIDQVLSALDQDIIVDEKLENLQQFIVKQAQDYKALSVKQFKFIKDNNARLYQELPKAPVLAEFAFILKAKGGPLLKEQFENTWQAATLNYATTVELFNAIYSYDKNDNKHNNDIQEENKFDNIKLAANAVLLTSQNTLARALQHYKHAALRAANSNAPAPNSERSQVLPLEEVKSLQISLDTAARLRRTLAPTPFTPRGRRYSQRGRGRHRGQRRYYSNGGGRGNYSNYRSSFNKGSGYNYGNSNQQYGNSAPNSSNSSMNRGRGRE